MLRQAQHEEFDQFLTLSLSKGEGKANAELYSSELLFAFLADGIGKITIQTEA
jgi:hypothetical protein